MKNTLLLFICLLLFACQKEKEQAALEDQKIQDYLSAVNWQATEHPSGFYYTMDSTDANCAGNCASLCASSCGDGCIRPCSYSQVEFYYKVYDIDSLLLGDNSPLLSHTDSTVFMWVEDMIPAMELAMTEIEEFTLGASGYLLIPSRLAYHTKGLDSQILPNATLLVYLKLVESHPHF